MAHYAQLDKSKKVISIVYLDNEIITDADGNEIEELGINHLRQHHGQHQEWVRTSYTGRFRNKYASIGDTYNNKLDAFIPPKPYSSWILNEEKIEWEAPIQKPSEDYLDYEWIEEQRKWFSIREYIFETYTKDESYSNIENAIQIYGLKNNTIVPVVTTEDYVASLENVKNFILFHQSYTNWSSSILSEWKKVYEDGIKKLKCDIYALKKISNEGEKEKFNNFVRLTTDAVFLEEKNNWLIYKRDKYQLN